MAVVGYIIVFVGWLLGVAGGIMMLVAAFSAGILWGLGCLFVPFVSLFFLVLHWDVAKRGFLTSLAGTGVALCGVMLMFVGGGMPGVEPLAEGPDAAGPRTALSSLAGEIKGRVPERPDSPASDRRLGLLVGRSLESLQDEFGKPKGRVARDGRVTLIYEGFMVTSDDGTSVTRVVKEAGDEPSPTRVP